MSAPLMRAKLVVQSITRHGDPVVQENLSLSAVCSSPFNPDGTSEDNTYARYTPMASLNMSVMNPALLGKIEQGQKFYVDFTPVAE